MLYHSEVHWPKRIRNKLPFGVRPLSYSQHSIRESKSDKYGGFQLPNSVNLNDTYIFEAEELNKAHPLTKIAFRLPIDNERSLVVVAIPEKAGLFVKTVWINLNSDKHCTLDKSKYVQG